MAENSRKNEFFDRESIAIIAAFTGNRFFLNMCSRQKAGEFDYSVIV